MTQLRIGILVVAYNAVGTLVGVLDRIPKEFRPKVAEVIVADDCSSDATYFVGLGYRAVVDDIPITVLRNDRNLGYGGNQKVGYRYALEHDLDVIVLLHGDGQYAPEFLPAMVRPIEEGQADAVFGSRMLQRGAARAGGMPLYKLVGNRILTRIENAALGTRLSEFHSGYRAYRVAALRGINFEGNSDGFDFDTEIIIQLHHRRYRMVETPIPTYYGDEICYVKGMRYAVDVLADVARYRAAELGLSTQRKEMEQRTEGDVERYPLKISPSTSHGKILSWLEGRLPLRILDLGCAGGLVAERARLWGHRVTGVDADRVPGVASRLDRFLQADLESGLPADIEGPFDVIIAADVLEHLKEPRRVLRDSMNVLAEEGLLLATVPNFTHWYPRLRVVTGRFDYDERGILDRTHLRFFTRQTFLRLVGEVGLEAARVESIGVPLEMVWETAGRVGRVAGVLNEVTSSAWPSLFAYQYLFELRRREGLGKRE